MGLSAPWQLGWLGLLVPLVLLYVLRRRRLERHVGSTLLWEAALRDLRAERPWRRLVPHVSLLLQALVIVVGALALAKPTGRTTVPAGAHVYVVIDTSMSMGASLAADPDRTRLHRAKARTLALFDDLPPGGELAVILAGDSPEVASPPTRQRSSVETALQRARVTGTRSALSDAVALAAQRAADAPAGSRVVLMTDRAAGPSLTPLPAPEDGRGIDPHTEGAEEGQDGEGGERRSDSGDAVLHLSGFSAPIELVDLGESVSNTAIIAADARPQPTEDRPDRVEVFARVARFGESPADVYITLATLSGASEDSDGDGAPEPRVIGSRRLTVTPSEAASLVFDVDLAPDASGSAPLLQLQLATARERDTDAIALDDRAVIPSPAARRLPVFLFGSPPPPLMRLLRTDRDVELFQTSLEAMRAAAEVEGGSAVQIDGLRVYSGPLPDTPPPGDSWVLGPRGERAFEVELAAETASAMVTRWAETDPRLRFVRFDTQRLGAVRTLGDAARPLVFTTAGPAIGVVSRPSGETTVVGADLGVGDWPRDPSFVVFFRNLLERARVRRAQGGVPAAPIGTAIRVRAGGEDGAPVVVTTPSGHEFTGVTRSGAALIPITAESGLFRVRTGERNIAALRNVLDPEASDLRPRLRIQRSAATSGHGDAQEANDAESARRDAPQALWPLLALLLLLLVAIEATWASREGAVS